MQKRNLATIAFIAVSVVFLILFLSFWKMDRNKQGGSDINSEKNASLAEGEREENGLGNNAEKVLREEDVRGILEDFAAKENYSRISDGNVLRDAIAYTLTGQENDLANRMVQVEKDLEARSGELADAPDMRSFINARVKFCLAKSIFNDDLKNACGISDPLGVDFSEPDDLTATEAVLPYFLMGLSHYVNDDYQNARAYFNKIEEHKQAGILLHKDPDFPLNGTNGVYNRICDKSKELLSIISAI